MKATKCASLLQVLLFAVVGGTAYPQEEVAGKVPLREMLHPDGTLSIPGNFSGAIDPRGWEMRLTRDGKPGFVATDKPMAAGDEYWDSRFGPAEPNGEVDAIAVTGGIMYVGGLFSTIGGIRASNIARWDGTSWTPLGSGVDHVVLSIAVAANGLYVGGWFATAGGITVNRIAKWDGSSWSALGSGISGGNIPSVNAIAVVGSDVYIGGAFTTAGGVNVYGIARWDGLNWNGLPNGAGWNGFVGIVQALAVSGSNLYVGGSIERIGSTLVNNIAEWNGSTWSSLGTGVDGTVLALAVTGNDLYIGGNFIHAGGINVHCVARWNGTSWFSMGAGIAGGNYPAPIVSSLAIDPYGRVFCAGQFIYADRGRLTVNNVALWDPITSTWHAASGPNGTGTNYFLYAVASSAGCCC